LLPRRNHSRCLLWLIDHGKSKADRSRLLARRESLAAMSVCSLCLLSSEP
jgi:hypothetical protein